MIPRRHLVRAAGALALLGRSSAWAQARKTPTRIIVGFPPGGTADVLARVLAQTLTRESAPVIVENKPGAGGRLGVVEMKNAAAEGHALLMSADPILVIYPHVFKTMPYNTLTDVLPLAPIATEPVGLVIGPMVPAQVRSLADFIAWCRQNPKQASYATAAAGTTMHFVGAMLARTAGMEFVHIPHRGGAAAIQDVIGGQIASTVTSTSQAVPLMASGKLRVLAVSGAGRYKRAPDAPTFGELGYRDIQAQVYYGIYLKAGTPPATVQELHGAIASAARAPEMVQTLDKLALDPLSLTQERFAAMVRSDHERWGPIVRATGYSADD